MADVQLYKLILDNGACPVDEWISDIRDTPTRARILRQLDKLERTNFGQLKLFDGIGEVKMDFGPGYRVYFGKHGNTIILLLGGGDKSTQKKDIAVAKSRFEQWKKSGAVMEGLASWSEE